MSFNIQNSRWAWAEVTGQVYMACNQQVTRLCGHCKYRPARAGFSLCERCVPQQAKSSKKYHLRIRQDAFNAYGGPQCACCGTLVDQFLTLDHIDGGGAAHRAKLRGDSKRTDGGGGLKLYLHLKRMGYPPGFQVLCMNCNFAKGKYGRCPHELV